MPITEGFRVENEDYTLIPIKSEVMEKGSEEIIKNRSVRKILDTVDNSFPRAQNKQMSVPVFNRNTVEDAIQAIAKNRAYAVPGQVPSSLWMTAGAAYDDKADRAVASSHSNFTSYDAYRYFDGCTTPLEWLRHVFGNDYQQKLARGYFVD